ncbi:MAG: diguanylate cyclase [Planctomycetes bacterium]|nr:diguanylate cyclase [Planctomycetota bacterium]
MGSERKELTPLEKAKEVLRVTGELTQVHDPTVLIESVLDAMIAMFGAERGFVIIEEPDGRRVMAARNFDRESVPRNESNISHSIARHVLATGEAKISTSVEGDEDMDGFATVHVLRLKSVACLPLKMRGKTFGVVYLDTTKRRSPFSDEDRLFLEALADQAAIAITNARLYRDAIRDGLTGLVSHRYFDIRLTEEVSRAVRHGRPLCLFMLDVDNFKLINDLHGHGMGNEILRTIAQFLRQTLRGSDLPVRSGDSEPQGELAGRYGGDEFEVLLPDTGRDGAKIVGERLLTGIRALEFGEGGRIRTTVSMGVCVCPEDGQDREALARKADEALYNAKRNGRNQLAFPGPVDGSAAGGAKTEGRDKSTVWGEVPLSRDAMRTVRLISRGMEVGLDLDRLLHLVLRQVAEAVACDRGLVLLTKDSAALTPVVGLGLTTSSYGEAGFEAIRRLVEEALTTGEPRPIWNAPEEARYAGSQGVPSGTVRSMLAVPIQTKDRVHGALYLDRAVTRPPLSEEDVNLVYAVATRVAGRMAKSGVT